MKNKPKSTSLMMYGFLIVFVSVVLGLTLYLTSYGYYNIYNIIKDRDLKQVMVTSRYIETIFDKEIDRNISYIDELKRHVIKEDLDVQKSLKALYASGGFLDIGMTDLNGKNTYSISGNEVVNPKLLQIIKSGNNYIDAYNRNNTFVFAVPFKHKQFDGFIWSLVDNLDFKGMVDLGYSNHLNIDIINGDGDYIVNLNDRFNGDNLFDELDNYKMDDSFNKDTILYDMSESLSNRFYIEDDENGRYINYSPLSVLDWYLFLSVDEEYVGSHVEQIETVYKTVVYSVIGVICAIVLIFFYHSNKNIKQINRQKDNLQSIVNLLDFMLKDTKDTPFVIKEDTSQLMLYEGNHKFVDYKISAIHPDELLAKGIISANDYLFYLELYKRVTKREDINGSVIKFNLNGEAKCSRLYLKAIENKMMIGYLEEYSEQFRQSNTIKQIDLISRNDSMTNLFHRNYFKQYVENDLDGDNLKAIAIVDIDNFKCINDESGHVVGDEVILKIADILKRHMKGLGIAGRLGGDEFMLYYENLKDRQELEKHLTKLKRSLEFKHHDYDITSSIGAYLYKGKEEYVSLYKKADEALYVVKRNSKDDYCIVGEAYEKDL